MNRLQRIRFKGYLCMLLLILLLFFLLGRLFGVMTERRGSDDMPKRAPVITYVENVWILGPEEGELRCFAAGEVQSYPMDSDMAVMGSVREQVADLELTDGVVTQITLKDEKVSGKVLSVSREYIEVEGLGMLPVAEDAQGYKLYGTLAMCSVSDICIGYDFTDFCLEDGEICAFLLAREGSMEYIRVLLRASDYAGIFHENVTVSSDSAYYITAGGVNGSAEPSNAEEQPDVAERLIEAGDSVEIGPDSPFLAGGRCTIEPAVQTGKLCLSSVNRSQGTPEYRGSIEVIKTEDGIVVINELPLEEYLYSVVPSEMPASYPAEALKAQAICARTYAYLHMLRAGYGSYGAHVDDSSSYQVYNNILEQEATTGAVRDTYGQLLYTAEGMLAETYYYSTSCGLGSDAHVWKTSHADDYPYIRPMQIRDGGQALGELTEEEFAAYISEAHSEDFESEESWYRWTYTVAEVDLAHMLEVLQRRYQANEKLVLTWDDRSGEYVSAPIKELDELKALYIEARGAGGVADELVLVTEEHMYKVISEHNIRYVLNDGVTEVVRQDGKRVASASLLPSAFFTIEIAKEEDCVVAYNLTGGGYGHGVGMSQNAARAMARAGYRAEDILSFFYDGCVVEKAEGE